MSTVGFGRRSAVGGLVAVAIVVMMGAVSPSSAGAVVLHVRGAGARSAVRDSYIVMLKDTPALSREGLAVAASVLSKAHHGRVGSVWPAFDGFSVRMSAADAQELAGEPAVDFVEQDQTRLGAGGLARSAGTVAGGGRVSAAVVSPAALQENAPWGLDRIDQVEPDYIDGSSALDGKYAYDDVAGEGAGVYVLGTGVNLGLADLGGRAEAGVNVTDDGSAAADCIGFTTRYADIIGGTTYGVAKRASLVSVKITDCATNTFTSQHYLDAVNWVIAHGVHPAVIFQTIGDYCVDLSKNVVVACPSDFAAAQVRAEEAAYASGFLVIDAAGDALLGGVGQDACDKSTGAAPHTLYVGATGIDPTTHKDQLANFSDFGRCVTMYAPGVDIQTAAGPVVDGDRNGSSSAAAAFVAGTAALFLAKPEFAAATPAQIAAELVTNRSTSPDTVGHPVIEGLSADSHDRMLYTGPPGFFTIDRSLSMSSSAGGGAGAGQPQLVGVTKDGRIARRVRNGDGSWGSWTFSATGGWSSAVAATNANGGALLGAIPQGGAAVWSRAESGAGTNTWFGWRSPVVPLPNDTVDKPLTWGHLAFAPNADGRVVGFGTDWHGDLDVFIQSAPNTARFGQMVNLSSLATSVTTTVDTSGRIVEFNLDKIGQVWRTQQRNAGVLSGGFPVWLPGHIEVNGTLEINCPAACSFAVDRSMVSISAAVNADGRSELVGLDAGGNPWRKASLPSGGANNMSSWAPLPAKTLADIAAATLPGGKILVLGVDPLGNIWQSQQTDLNAPTYTNWAQIDGQLRP